MSFATSRALWLKFADAEEAQGAVHDLEDEIGGYVEELERIGAPA